MPRVKKGTQEGQSLLQRLQSELEQNQSYLNLALGVLIVLVLGVLAFNYFKQGSSNLGPAQQSQNAQEEKLQRDVDPKNLPGKYTVKEGDTLFKIAENYYKDGLLYPKIVEANQVANENLIQAGQVLEIPKVELKSEQELAAKPSPTGSDEKNGNLPNGKGGAVNQTIWGEAIISDTYTVTEGDWLSKIAGRAYGDIYVYEKIAKANNIQNPDLIEPGTVLKIPR